MVLAGHIKLAAARQAAHDLAEKLLRLIPRHGSRTALREEDTPPPRPETLMEDGWEPAETLQREAAQRRYLPPDCDGGIVEKSDTPGRYSGGRYRG
ncbi:hypothetical protein [Leisingera thetidis]|uniref:hypothetical protein n=1 Tax=Leisingera thetidis TaxID=2930199 RepID=UPI0021F7C810|nr:hypothetical protein [Leisingera thetidis]